MSALDEQTEAKHAQDREFASWQCAELIRDILRSVSSDSDTGLNPASRMLNLVGAYAELGEGITWHHVFNDALKRIRQNINEPMVGDDLLEASRRGMKYYAERCAEDSAAKGRASRRRSEFEGACEWVLEGNNRSRL